MGFVPSPGAIANDSLTLSTVGFYIDFVSSEGAWNWFSPSSYEDFSTLLVFLDGNFTLCVMRLF